MCRTNRILLWGGSHKLLSARIGFISVLHQQPGRDSRGQDAIWSNYYKDIMFLIDYILSMISR